MTEVNMVGFLNPELEEGYDSEALFRAVEIATRIGVRQTNVTLDLPEWDIVQKRDRLTGVSLSGVEDFESALGWDKVDRANIHGGQYLETISISPLLAELLDELRMVANDEAMRYAKEMRIPAPLLVTTEKPSGTISKLPMISSGVHKSRAPYFIRRVRITASDPLAQVMLEAGYPVYPSVTSNGPTEKELYEMTPFQLAQELQKSNTWIIEFPIKTSAQDKSSDESAVRQLGRYLDFQRYWTDHNTSITIQFSEDEVDALIDMLLENWDDYVAVSFIKKDTTAYPQLPEEIIDEAEYNRRVEKLTHINPTFIVEALKELERENVMSELLDQDCIGGACPIR